MTFTRTRSVLLSVALCSVPAIILILSPAAEAAKKEKAKPAAAKKKAPSGKAGKNADSAVVAPANQVWEKPPSEDITKIPTPPPAPEPAPTPSPAETKPAPEPALAAVPAATPAAEKPAAPSPEQPAAPPPPPEEETMPAFVPQAPPPPTQYVEHLGPTAYPGGGPSGPLVLWPNAFRWGPEAFRGQIRGLHGGSLWLEPSFHGLQWPYMPKTGVGISGSAWVDNGYETINRESPTVPNTTRWLQQGRAVLRVTPTFVSGGFFIQAQAELVANGCQSTGSDRCNQAGSGTVDTDDLWVRIGQWNLWDVKVGRFEGWELYHTGMGLDINTVERRGAWDATTGATSGLAAPDYYGVTFLHDRTRGMGLGYLAAHIYPLSVLRVELLGELGTKDTSNDGDNYLGGRPAVIFDLGWLKLKGGAEYEKRTSGDQDMTAGVKSDTKHHGTKKGFGGAFQLVFDPYVEFGGNIAQGSVKNTNNDGGPDTNQQSNTVTSVGGFANVRVARAFSGSRPAPYGLDDLLLGGGVDWTTWYGTTRLLIDYPADYAAHLQIFGAIQYLVFKQLFIKAVFAYARADLLPNSSHESGKEATNYSNTMLSARVRLMYLY
jgi:hypothetical protein